MKINMARLLEMAEEQMTGVGYPEGICINCGCEQPADPDARAEQCEDCGAHRVYGVEELLMM